MLVFSRLLLDWGWTNTMYWFSKILLLMCVRVADSTMPRNNEPVGREYHAGDRVHVINPHNDSVVSAGTILEMRTDVNGMREALIRCDSFSLVRWWPWYELRLVTSD